MQRRWVIGVVAALALAGASVGAAGVQGHPPVAVAAKTCSASYKHAVINGAQKCLRRGQLCAKAYKSQYRRYGFTCSGSPARLR